MHDVQLWSFLLENNLRGHLQWFWSLLGSLNHSLEFFNVACYKFVIIATLLLRYIIPTNFRLALMILDDLHTFRKRVSRPIHVRGNYLNRWCWVHLLPRERRQLAKLILLRSRSEGLGVDRALEAFRRYWLL